ncbi:LuxR C-terminal-related transcriptional regulator, partial [Pseudomonas sp.]|uniref:helix-turn-helix transcriptional regulator n=1 Tax=Pseudomonas sp. TaxID=306 RepID=UPI0028A85421
QRLHGLPAQRLYAVRARLTIYEGHLLALGLQPQQARTRLVGGIGEARACRDVSLLIGYCVLATLEGRSGNLPEAFVQLAEAERLMHIWDIPPVYYLAMITLVKCDLWLGQGQLELAQSWLERLAETYGGEQPAAAPECHPQLPLYIELQRAALERHQGQAQSAERRLRALCTRAQVEGGQLLAVVAQVQLTLLMLAGNRESEARQQFGESLAGALGGALLPFNELFVQRPEWLRERLRERPGCPVRGALSALIPAPSESASTTAAALADALSSRELAVLQLIAQGCSNQEISDQLFISLHTVKTHARHINAKLGVERRTQAVAQAKTLGLLS